ncbi:hypothetical protein E2C01_079611 [Portunus trituberculatus]|uniref:Uncharacterized protein n=1 Tax=Portunus trituberculatus TaxID=210409 RepID=A0A5B7IHD3_PORTR|nr:hypothetical protein [Portunus trituberculatus]
MVSTLHPFIGQHDADIAIDAVSIYVEGGGCLAPIYPHLPPLTPSSFRRESSQLPSASASCWPPAAPALYTAATEVAGMVESPPGWLCLAATVVVVVVVVEAAAAVAATAVAATAVADSVVDLAAGLVVDSEVAMAAAELVADTVVESREWFTYPLEATAVAAAAAAEAAPALAEASLVATAAAAAAITANEIPRLLQQQHIVS